jgi:putative GTP pyrophosphokinase
MANETMTAQNNPETPKADVGSVLTEFDKKKEILTTICDRTKNLIEDCLRDADIRFQSVQSRVKAREKIRTKYLDPQKNYKCLNDITDQAALRIITYYEDEVDRVADVVNREFDVDKENSVDRRETEPDKFGYYALNYVCTYLPGRTSHAEYKRFTDIRFEVQVTSILRHAWSEIEHPWYDLKGAFPDNIKRRFARMAALLEIAESEFLSLKKLQLDYNRSVDIQVGARVPDLPLDIALVKSFIEQEPLVQKIDKSIASLLEAGLFVGDLSDTTIESRLKAANMAGLTRLEDIRDSLAKYETAILEYVERCQSLWHVPPGFEVAQGVSIYHMAMMLIADRGEKEVVQALDSFGLTRVPNDPAKQSAIARDVLARRPK